MQHTDSQYVPKALKKYIAKWVAIWAGASALFGGGLPQAIQWFNEHIDIIYIP